MYLSRLTIENFRCFGDRDQHLDLTLRRGLTALVGENDSGKTAIIDAIRFALGTTDQEWFRLNDTDFHEGAASRQIRIVCWFQGLNARDKRAFLEYLTYGDEPDDLALIVNWTAIDTGERRRGRPYRRVEVVSGRDAVGPTFDVAARDLLRVTYM
ncbi:MAG: AAA family ATPase, partial [Deltaproteobacteria bacterium]|nr:AAA family ATPase [Deltaproteobacteria bacterium]